MLLVADDIPRNMLGTYGAAHNLAPNLDALARDGLTFDMAYTTASLCTPSRFSLLTGRYASNASSIPSHRPWNLVGFNTFLTGAEPTIAHHLSQAGYATAFCGKYHLGFPLPKGQVAARAGGSSRTKFGGSGRGLSYDELAAVGTYPHLYGYVEVDARIIRHAYTTIVRVFMHPYISVHGFKCLNACVLNGHMPVCIRSCASTAVLRRLSPCGAATSRRHRARTTLNGWQARPKTS